MLNRTIVLSALALALLVATGTRAEPGRTLPSAAQIRGWVDELNHDDYFVRERAAAQLVEAGPIAIGPLADGIVGSNPEVAWRSSEVLERMAMQGDQVTLARIVRVLQTLSKRHKPSLAAMAEQMHARQRAYREQQAAAMIRKFGGQMVSPYGEFVDEGLVFGGGIAIDAIDIMADEVPAFVDPTDLLKGRGGAEGVDEVAVTEPQTDFRLPVLDEADEAVWDPLAWLDDPFPSEEPSSPVLADEAPALPAGGMVIAGVGGPVFVVGAGGMASPSGTLMLNREWRGGDSALRYARDLYNIGSLQVEHADLTDKALEHLAKMPSLAYLNIRGGKFSREALRTFHRKNRKVAIMVIGEGMMGVNGTHHREGCILDSVFSPSGAHDAGLQAGDEVIQIEDDEIRDFSDLTIAVGTRAAGDKLRVVYKRGEEKRETVVTLGTRAPGQ
jgi:hypothetical protein